MPTEHTRYLFDCCYRVQHVISLFIRRYCSSALKLRTFVLVCTKWEIALDTAVELRMYLSEGYGTDGENN